MKLKALFLILMISLLVACNDEAGINPANDNNILKLIPGKGIGDIPVSISLLAGGDYLVVSNTSFRIDAATISKIRVIRLTHSGELVFDQYFPSTNDQSWEAKRTHIIDGNIIIGGNSTSQNMLFLKLNTKGDDIAFQTTFESSPLYLDSKLIDNELMVLSSASGAATVQAYSIDNFQESGTFSKTFNVKAVPVPSLLVKGDTLGFATNTTINYSLRKNNEDLDDDDRLSTTTRFEQINIKHLASTPLKNTAVGFGEVKNGDRSNWFAVLSDTKDNLGEPKLSIFDEQSNTNDILHNMHIEEDHILLCGSRATLGSGNSNLNSNFLIMKTDLQGKFKFIRSFGSTSSANVLYDALWDNGHIITVGTVDFGGTQTIVITKLSEEGQLIR